MAAQDAAKSALTCVGVGILAPALSIPVLSRSLVWPPESHCLHALIIPLLSFFFPVFSLSLSLFAAGSFLPRWGHGG